MHIININLYLYWRIDVEDLIVLKDLYKTYGDTDNRVDALNGVNINIKRGEFTAIVGTSGSGKSTLMNIIGCLDLPSSGSYVLDETDIMDYNDKELSLIRNKKIGFIFQCFNLVSGLTAFENVELPLIYRGMDRTERKKLVTTALKRVSLEGRMNHRPSEMSGGQQQRVAIARALAAQPPIILADEPTGNLDKKSGEAVMEMICELHRQGKTIVLITHDMKVAGMAERIIQISDGKVVEVVE